MLVAEVLPRFMSEAGMSKTGPLPNLKPIVGIDVHGAVQ